MACASMKNIELKLVSVLMKDSYRSDRELAKILSARFGKAPHPNPETATECAS